MNSRRLKIVLAAVVATVAVISLTTLLVVNYYPAGCELVDWTPDYCSYEELKNIPSKDFSMLATMGAYLVYRQSDDTNDSGAANYPPSKVFMPLKFESLSYEQKDSDFEVRFETNCSKLTLDLYLDPTDYFVQSKGVRVELSLANGDNQACYLDEFTLGFQNAKHYSCFVYRPYDCSVIIKDPETGAETKKVVATLIVDVLALELDGDPDKHRDGIYSKPASVCP